MKLAALFFICLGLVTAQDHDGGFLIRFEPTVILQSGAPIPFKITVQDPRYKPLPDAKVTLQIETDDHLKVQVFKAVQTEPGIYLAKATFPEAGAWLVYVHVQRNAEFSERTIKFSVAAPQN